MHAVKVERHDTVRHEHHTNTGVRRVETYRTHAHGLFVARPFYGHPRIAYWQAHLLPALGIQLCRYAMRDGPSEFDYYIDVGSIRQQDGVWELRDLYLDLTVWNGVRAEVLDTDELLTAVHRGFLSTEEAMLAVGRAHGILNELARHAYDVNAWLASRGLHLEWREPVVA